MRTEITLKEDVYKEIKAIEQNIDKINDGKEMGAWLLGEWKIKEGTIRLEIDEIIIPKQEVSGADVDINPEHMIDMIKEFGNEKCNRIKGHWHIHPFSEGRPSWSSTDEEKISDFTEPEKNRPIFAFLLSSKTMTIGRIEITAKATINGTEIFIKNGCDGIEVRREEERIEEETIKRVEERIKEKVTKKKYGFTETIGWGETIKGGRRIETITRYEIYMAKEEVIVRLEEDFAMFIMSREDGNKKLMDMQSIEIEKDGRRVWTYITPNKKARKALARVLEKELEKIAEEEEVKMIEETEEEDPYGRIGISYYSH